MTIFPITQGIYIEAQFREEKSSSDWKTCDQYRWIIPENLITFKTRENEVKREQVGFVQANPGQDGSMHSHITCNKCKKKGHYTNQCPGDNGSTINAQVEHENNRNQDDNDSDANEDISNNEKNNEENQTRSGT